MPRGVYDRSKAKKKGAAKAETSAVAAPKVKRAYNKRAQPALAGQVAQAIGYDFNTITQLRELAQIRSIGINQVDGLIKKLVSKLEADFDAANTKVETAPEVKETKANGKATKAQNSELPAPVPFVVPAASAPTPA